MEHYINLHKSQENMMDMDQSIHSFCTLEATHQTHFESAKKQEKDPEGGPFPAYPSGKTWDEPSGKTGAGKKFFHNIIDGSKVKTEPFYSAIWLLFYDFGLVDDLFEQRMDYIG